MSNDDGNQQAKLALDAAWERFAGKMRRIRSAVLDLMRDLDERRRTKEIEEARKKLTDI
jgi:hypothetical protein